MYAKRYRVILLLLVGILMLAACNPIIKGSGNVISETRQVSDFDRITLSGSGDVIVTQGMGESLTIETDDNVMGHVKSEVDGGTLNLGFEQGINFISPSQLVFYVDIDDLTGLTISGSGAIEADRIETESLDAGISGSGNIKITELRASEVGANISGSGEIDLAGEVVNQDVNISGSGEYQTGDICSETVSVNISGSGDATVCALERLDTNISGSGSVNYYGRPSINSSGSGSGEIINLGEKE